MTSVDSVTSFPRTIELYNSDIELTITQLYVGDVGCVVWDSALVLGAFLQSPHTSLGSSLTSHKTVIELGAGTGAVGLIACALGYDETVTVVTAL